MPALTRGPLPPSVYWRRRLVVLTVALFVFWAALHLLGGGSSTPQASPTAATTSTSASPTPAATSPSASASASATASASVAPTPTVLPTPTGACPPSDVSVSPAITNAAAGASVPVTLTLRTFSTPACTWHVGHKTMQVKITTAGGTSLWSTVQCPAALTPRDVVVYQNTPTTVSLSWSARHADSDCSTHTPWVHAGSYRVSAVALGGVPDEATFTLGQPVPVTPAAPASAAASARASTSPTAAPKTTSPSSAPSTHAETTAPTKHKKKQIAD